MMLLVKVAPRKLTPVGDGAEEVRVAEIGRAELSSCEIRVGKNCAEEIGLKARGLG
jgi:hypothetical protein